MSHAGPLSPSCPPPSAPTAMSADEPRSPDSCSWWENLGSVCKATGADVHQWSGCSSDCHLSPAPHRDGFRLWQGTRSGCGSIVTLPSEGDHPSCTTASVSSVSCPSAFPPQIPLAALTWGAQITPRMGERPVCVPRKGPQIIAAPPGVSVSAEQVREALSGSQGWCFGTPWHVLVVSHR